MWNKVDDLDELFAAMNGVVSGIKVNWPVRMEWSWVVHNCHGMKALTLSQTSPDFYVSAVQVF